MALVVKDRVKESTTTTGTGTLTLAGAETGFQTFAAIGNGNTTYYAITDGSDFEVGLGTYTSAGTLLSRDTVYSSSNGDALVNWGAGEKLVLCVQPASRVNMLDASGNVTGVEFDEYLDFNTSTTNPSHSEGRVFYDQTRDSLAYYNSDSNMTIHAGQDTVLRVYNNSGAEIGDGSPVYLTGESGAVPTIAKATASGTLDQSYAVGIASSTIANNSYGFITTNGIVFFDTSHLTVGEQVHVSTTAGETQTAAPTYPNYATDLGICLLSSASNGCVYVSIQTHSFEALRITGAAHFDSNLTIDGDLIVNGTQTIASSEAIAISGAWQYFNSGDTIGSANTTFTGTGLDDGVLTGHYTGTAATRSFYVEIDATGTPDTFKWSHNSDLSAPEATGVAITGGDQALADGISINFNATTGHTVGDKWSGTATPVLVDTGIASNINTGTSGVGYTHIGFFYDVSTNYWTLFDEYDPEPEGTIDIAHASFSYGSLKLDTLIGNVSGSVTGNVTGNVAGNVSGSASSVDAGDNVKSLFGDSDDLQLYHNSNNSYVFSTAPLVLNFETSFLVQTNNATNTAIDATEGAGVGLYYNNVKKLETVTGGATVSGTMTASTVKLGDWTIFEDTDGKLKFAHSGTVKATLDDTGTFAAANDIFTDETLG